MIVSLSFLYLILITIWAPRASWEINEHSYCYWNQHKGILCSFLSLSKQLITWSSSIISSAVTIERFLPFQFVFRASSGRQATALVAPTNAAVTAALGALPGGCAGPSYLGPCKAGVKHKALVNDQPRAYDHITPQWIYSRQVEYYWWIYG